jgi:hypothetical protein
MCAFSAILVTLTLVAGSVAPLKLTVLGRSGEQQLLRLAGLGEAGRTPRRTARPRVVSSDRAHCDDDGGDPEARSIMGLLFC